MECTEWIRVGLVFEATFGSPLYRVLWGSTIGFSSTVLEGSVTGLPSKVKGSGFRFYRACGKRGSGLAGMHTSGSEMLNPSVDAVSSKQFESVRPKCNL